MTNVESRVVEEVRSYSFEVSGTEEAANLTEVSDQQIEDLSWPLLMMRTDLLQDGKLPLNCLQAHLETRDKKKKKGWSLLKTDTVREAKHSTILTSHQT